MKLAGLGSCRNFLMSCWTSRRARSKHEFGFQPYRAPLRSSGVLVGLALGPLATNTPVRSGVLGATLESATQAQNLSEKRLARQGKSLRSALQSGPQHSRSFGSVGRGWPWGQSYQHARGGYCRQSPVLMRVWVARELGESPRQQDEAPMPYSERAGMLLPRSWSPR